MRTTGKCRDDAREESIPLKNPRGFFLNKLFKEETRDLRQRRAFSRDESRPREWGWEQQQENLPQGNFLWQGGEEGPDQYSYS